MEWLKAIASAFNFLVGDYFSESRKKKKAKRVKVPDNIWDSTEAAGEAMRPPPPEENGCAEYSPTDEE